MYVLWGGLQEKGYFADFWKHKRQAMFYERINNVPKALAHVDMAKKCLALVPFPVLHARIRAHSFKLNMRVHILTDATTELLMHIYARTRRRVCSLSY